MSPGQGAAGLSHCDKNPNAESGGRVAELARIKSLTAMEQREGSKRESPTLQIMTDRSPSPFDLSIYAACKLEQAASFSVTQTVVWQMLIPACRAGFMALPIAGGSICLPPL